MSYVIPQIEHPRNMVIQFIKLVMVGFLSNPYLTPHCIVCIVDTRN